MKKYGLWIVLTLVFAGIILGTLGTWSVPLGHGISAFWPAFVVQVGGSAWFGGWGVLAAVLFPILTNALANVGWSGILGFIPANLAQGLIPAWAFRHFRVDPALPGRKGLVFYAVWGALIPAAAGGLLGSIAVVLFGEASWSDYPLLVMKWAAPNLVVSLLIGIPILRELTPLWRDLGLLVKNRWSFDQASGWMASPRHFRDMPIHLKLVLAMCGTGLGPLLVLSLLELARNGGKSVPGNMTPLFLTISLVALVLAVGFLSRETVRPLQKLKEQVEALMQRRDGVLTVERADEIGQLGQAFAFLLDDRRHAEASLQASEEKYRTLVENLNVGVFQSTLNGTFLHANSAVIHLAGFDNWEEFKQLPASRLCADEADREWLIAELKAQGRVWNVETRSLKKDGTIYWIALNAVLLMDTEGKPASILGSVIDITERKQAEEALRETEAIFASFMEYSPVYVFFKDKDVRSLRLSKNYEQMLGMPISQMLGKTMDELFPSDLAKSMVEDDLRILNQGQRVDVVEEMGGHVYETTKFPIFKDGKPNMLAGFTVDITERKRAEEMLREKEEKFRVIVETTKEWIWMIDLDGRHAYSNPAVEALLGYSVEEIVNKKALDLLHPEDCLNVESMLREKKAQKTGWAELILRWRHKDGSYRYLESNAAPVFDAEGQLIGFQGTDRDITERKRAEEALRRSEERLSSFMDSASDSFYLLDLDLRFVEINQKGLEITGKKKEDIIGKSITEIVPDVVESGRYERHKEVIRTGKPFVVEDFIPHPVFGDMHFILKSFKVGNGLGVIATDITARKRAEEALRESEERFRTLYDNATIGLYRTTPAGRILMLNPAGVRMLGYGSFDEIAQRDLEDPKYHVDHPRNEFREKLERDGTIFGLERKMSKKDGSIIIVRESAKVTRNENGEILYYDGSFEDITERKRAEEALRESEAVYRQAIEVAGAVPYRQIYAESSPIVRYTFIGDGIRQITGYGPEEFDTELWDSITLERVLLEDLAEYPFEDAIERVRSGDNPIWKCEHRIRAHDGKIHWVFEAAVELRDEHGVSHGSIGLYQDITERKRAEDDLQRRIKELAILYDASRVLSQSLEPEVIGQRLIETMEQLLGYEHGAVLVLDDQTKEIIPLALSAQSHGEEFVGQDKQYVKSVISSTQGGIVRWVIEHGQPVRLDDVRQEPRYLSMREDICSELCVPLRVGEKVIGALNVESARPDAYTEGDERLLTSLAGPAAVAIENAQLYDQIQNYLATLERRVIERTAQLEAANKELESFSYSVSHDLRAPLRSIDGFTRIFLEEYADKVDAEGQQYLERVRTAGRRMSELVDDLLSLSRLSRSELRRQAVDLSALAQSVADALRQMEPGRETEIVIEAGMQTYGDERLLRIVLENLIGNAWKFTAKHPRARIEVGVMSREGEQAYFVRDDGTGFDMKYADKLFGVFQRLHSATEFEGTGIGLATVQRIIHRHGGRVWAESAVEQGATFYFTLPMKE